MKIFRKYFFAHAIVAVLLIMLCTGCKKDEEENTPAVHETGTVTDIEGNIYKTVKIGDQWWMAENLHVKKYRNGTTILNGQDSIDWIQTTGVYCLYDNN